MCIKNKKKHLRQRMLAERRRLQKPLKTRYDDLICKQVYEDITRQKSMVVHCYLPFEEEINIRPLIQKLLDENKRVICPKTLPKGQLSHHELLALDQIEEGLFSTFHPKTERSYEGEIDYIIVPGLAFDEKGNRIGYGGGYYDRFLKKQGKSHKVGLAYPFQIIDNLPIESFDVVLDAVYFIAL